MNKDHIPIETILIMIAFAIVYYLLMRIDRWGDFGR